MPGKPRKCTVCVYAPVCPHKGNTVKAFIPVINLGFPSSIQESSLKGFIASVCRYFTRVTDEKI